ncbi:hypothetical protein D9619_010595 [Psilocybe cf. subviscida]|uniref:Methyltransferase n=1 Tax=Psilocybe cf. subviscida TaxID=2480587 RepID=A0A8H5ASN7_9AGAR|nr:hypothetical protein D9619_010595 [Psilocybe cf. subviscida]
MSSTTSPTTTTATLHYFVPPKDGERAFSYTYRVEPITGTDPKRNFGAEEKDVVIENARGNNELTLDSAGFQYFTDPAKHTSFTNEEEIVNEYYPETVELIKRRTGASRVVIFDHTIRRRQIGEDGTNENRRQPVSQVHVDQSTKAAVDRVHRHLPVDEAPELLKKRFQIINIWRPIEVPALDWPLALCDYRSVDPSKDLEPVALIFPHREGETLGVKYNPNHKWKYLHGMTPEEVAFIKCFDSVQDGSVAILTPHTGFKDPQTPENAPLRQSIEVRALVFYD